MYVCVRRKNTLHILQLLYRATTTLGDLYITGLLKEQEKKKRNKKEKRGEKGGGGERSIFHETQDIQSIG